MKVDENNYESSGCHVLLIASSCEECPDYHMGVPILENALIPGGFDVPNFYECLTIENLPWPEKLHSESGECHENIRRCVYYDEIIPNYVFVQDDKPVPCQDRLDMSPVEDPEGQCDGTPCPTGCCPEQNWVCCNDYGHSCAATPCDCPPP